jgi:hypothetical protein
VLLFASALAPAQGLATPGAKDPANPNASPAAPAKQLDDNAAQGDKALTAQQHLDACRKRYETAKTYRDEGTVESVINTGAQKLTESKPFATAFERAGRFHWQFEHSAMPGHKPDQKFIVWSDDQKSFKTSWTLTGKNETFPSIDRAMAGPSGVSGGSATAVIPLLRPDMKVARDTALHAPEIAGTEKIDGVDCTMIRGKQTALDAMIVLWLDPTHAIRKIKTNLDVDPAKIPGGGGSSKFSSETVITIRPVFDEKIEDKYFEAKSEK